MLLGTTRRAIEMTQRELAVAAGLSRTHVDRLEHGTRRTRRSTLTRIAAAFVVEVPKLGPVDRLVDDFVREAGPALAEESIYAERVGRRRANRSDAEHKRLAAQEARRLALWLYEQQYGPNRWMRSEQELDDLIVEMWGYYHQRQAERAAKRRDIERLARRPA
jgi:transcriptional regulator with XRE-family HTH domain